MTAGTRGCTIKDVNYSTDDAMDHDTSLMDLSSQLSASEGDTAISQLKPGSYSYCSPKITSYTSISIQLCISSYKLPVVVLLYSITIGS